MNNKSEKGLEIERLQLKIAELENREKNLLKQLRLNSSLYSKILDELPINIFLENREGKTVLANEHTCRGHGKKLEDLIGKTVFDFFPENIAKTQRKIDLEVWKQRKLLTNEVKVNFQGKESFMLTGKTIIHLPESEEEYLLGFGIDITEKKKAEELIAQMAYQDALTGLPNRWYVKSFLQDFLANQHGSTSQLGVLMLDLDHFKVINDRMGHQAGDVLLKVVAKRLKKAVGYENILARLGGDEFLLLIPGLKNKDEAIKISEIIIKVMEKPIIITGQKFIISTSIGISWYPQDGENLNNLIKNADFAMYHSKTHGRNCYTVYAQIL